MRHTRVKILRNLPADDGRNTKILAGTVLTVFTGPTYGCISPEGLAVTDDLEGKGPFFEVPQNSVDYIS